MEQGSNSQGRVCPRGASYYTWAAGDTLQRVAMHNHTTERAIRAINPGVNFATIAAGETICIPTRAMTCGEGGDTYTIRAGDTFFQLAKALGVTTEALMARNPGIDPEHLQIGQTICIPRQQVGDGTGNDMNTVPPGISCPVGYTPRTVRAGETYADLLVDLNVSYRALRSTNPSLQPGSLVAGTAFCAPPAGTRQVCESGHSYVIQEGETLSAVAAKHNTTPGRLLMLNQTLLPTDFTRGTVICVP